MDDFQVFAKPVGALCNLACSYCYYLDKKQTDPASTLFRMPDDLLEEYIRQHIEASSGPDLFFSWHGGEPTLAGIEFFRKVVVFQRKHAPPDCRISNGIQTNGTLLDHEWCRFLSEHHFIVGISMDGPYSLHSANRHRKDGSSSFDEVLQGYRLLKQYRIPCEILCVVSAANVEHPLELYRFFKSLDAGFITFLPLVEKTATGDKVSANSVPAGKFGEFLCAVFDEWKAHDIGTVKVQLSEEALRSAFGLDHTLCIFKETCGRVPVVEANGNFYPCDHYVDPGNPSGNIRSTPLRELLESQDQQSFGRAKRSSLPLYCLQCEFLTSCNGACPKDRFLHAPDGEPGLNYLCEGYKKFFNHCKPFIEQVAEVWKNSL
jgi:uncharacterized protein